MRTRVLKVDPDRPEPEAIREAAALLRRGGLVAFPTETVYGLGANLEDPQAIQELYQVKQRPFEKRVTLHVADPSAVEAHGVEVSPAARELMSRFWPGPLTLVLGRRDGSTLGFRMPRHPVALALLREAGVPVVAPSANLSGSAPPRTAQEVLRDLSDRIDLVLDAGPTPGGVESTVLDLSGDRPRVLRRGAIGEEIEKDIVRLHR
ncbi:MAG: threonylcarbamoyl-AMP synthase [Candidatus Omnitrophica bacterium]|nr:threonylcarbamoyl-AMP synthase [Candidatus Omnitrophota bacterium]